jgi:ubiquinone/menaquinone biosynthesis C-methylase UbiE
MALLGLYDRVFARMYDPFMQAAERRLFPPHREYLTDVSGEVLDLGSGTGANFPYFAGREDVRLHAIEPDSHMLRRARRRAVSVGLEVDLREARAEALPYGDESMDAVVAGIVFCTIPDPEAALEEVARVLKPGGEFRFLEHVRDHGRTAWAQALVEPVWKRVAGGCHVTRDTAGLFTAHDAFEVVEVERVDVGVFPADPFVRGRLRRLAD